MAQPTPAEIEKFIQRVKFRGYDDAYIDKDEEKAIYGEAINDGMDMDEAHSLLRQACARNQFALESNIRSTLEVVLDQFCVNDGKIDLGEFKDSVAIAFKLLKRDAPRTTVAERDMELMSHEIIIRKRYAIQRALKRHFKKTLGLDVA